MLITNNMLKENIKQSEGLGKPDRMHLQSSEPVQKMSTFEINKIEAQNLANLFKLQRDVDEANDKVAKACAKFTDSVISREQGGVIFAGWGYNNRGTLIEITYTKPEDFDRPAVNKEYVSFEELAPYMDNIFRD